jgi:hypothetical protein
MTQIPSGTKFIGISSNVPVPENRSALSNSYQEVYTIDDIIAEASAADTNIYNSDGTLDANRTVDLDGNTIEFDNGKVGVNVTPTAPLSVQTIAVPSSNESIARFTVSDAAGANLTILNASSVDGRFIPEISGVQGLNTDSAFKQTSYIQPTQDSGSTPVTIFSAALSTLAAIVTRPLYQFRNAGTNLLTILANGNLGIGTATPSTPLQVRSTAIPSAGEPIARFDVSDSSAYLQISNGTTTNGAFAPMVQGRQVGTSTQAALQTESIIDVADDTGTTPITIFKTRLNTIAPIVTRPVFQFSNWTLDIMTMLPNGNVGIGTTTPGEKLEVNGKTKTTTFQLTTTPTAGYVLTSDASGNGTWAPASGGLTYFTEAQNTAAPNATVPVDSLTAVSAATNADFAVKPKGTGAILAAIPDNTTAGGNKRGANAIDLSTATRSNADRVASGDSSVIIGQNCRAYNTGAVAIGLGVFSGGLQSVGLSTGFASGDYAFSIGNNSTASGRASVAFGGTQYGGVTASGEASVAQGNSTASGLFSIAVGESNTASAQGASAVGGRNNLANAYLANVSGGYCTANAVEGRQVRGRALGIVVGETQKSEFFLSIRTTENTATTVTVAGGAAGTSNQVILSNNSAYRFKGTIIGKQSGSTNIAAWDVDGIIVRGANAASTTLSLGNVTLVQNTPAWGTPTLAADTTNGGLRVQVTGAAATNIQWTAAIETTEVIYA